MEEKSASMTIPILGLKNGPPYLLLLAECCDACEAEGVPDDEHDCGAFLLFDSEFFEYSFQCERDDIHDEEICGRWGEESFHWTKDQVVKAALEQQREIGL